jgi:hypothetical protein
MREISDICAGHLLEMFDDLPVAFDSLPCHDWTQHAA